MTITTFSPPDQPAAVANSALQTQLLEWPGLAVAAEHLGVPLSTEVRERLEVYLRLLLERSAQFNLTAIRDPQAMERRLFLDAIAMIPTLDSLVKEGSVAKPHVMDVGSGAGFPGLVLKIVRPDLEFTLLDATGKKVRFLEEVISATGVTGVRALHGRAEELARDRKFREKYNFVTARAVANLPVLLELTTPFLDVGGIALLPKSLDLAAELRDGTKAARMLGCRVVSTDVLPTVDTRLVVVEKVTLTPKAYPRGTGIPSQSPLGVQT